METHRILTSPLNLLVLLAASALFAAAELSLAAVRRARVEQLVREGRRGARSLLRALDGPERLAAGAQLGRALAMIALGVPQNLLDQAWFQMGEILLAQGKRDQALPAYQKVLDLNPARTGQLVQRAQQRIDQLRFGGG